MSNNDTNISSMNASKQVTLSQNDNVSGLNNNSPADVVFLIKSCTALANPCLGTDDDDNMTGDNGINVIEGRGGNDIIYGNGSMDEIYGELGNDVLNGGDGNDYMHGEVENAKIGGPDMMRGEGGNDEMYGDIGNDNMSGGSGDDVIYGWEDDNYIEGGDGNDLVVGWHGNDILSGGDGMDHIFGYDGSDHIQGGPGDDKIYHNEDAPTAPDEPDNSKDIIDCGSGLDEAWINSAVDHDVHLNCEIVHGAGDNDLDGDGVPNMPPNDNCPIRFNPDQIDIDIDGIGDVCDPGLFSNVNPGGVFTP